ncbi:hypothetical protein TNCV_3038521 [Trichonephila clavipes]|nr:hypothetical protein TNCV_3038521 [Trichonephila clavipes]
MAPGRLDSMGSTIGVKISSTYLRAVLRRTTKDDRVSQEIAPPHCHCEMCMPLDNKCRIGPLARCASMFIQAETESGFITEDDTSPVCHTPVAEVGKNPVDTAYDDADVGSSSQLRSVVS